MDHIVSGCEVLAKTDYISRHNNAAAYLYWSICTDHDIEMTDNWYQHQPETVMHNKNNNNTIMNNTIMWDMTVNTRCTSCGKAVTAGSHSTGTGGTACPFVHRQQYNVAVVDEGLFDQLHLHLPKAHNSRNGSDHRSHT